MFVVFEGIDGSGKTTISKLVSRDLSKLGYHSSWFKNPTDMKHGNEIRRVFESGQRLSPEEEVKLFMDDRRDNVEKEVRPALQEERVVIQDRYYFSTAAYQGAAGLSWNDIVSDNESFCILPDLIFFLEISPEEALSRIDEEGRQRTAPEKLDTQQEIDRVYREMFNVLINDGAPYEVIVLDGTLSIEELTRQAVRKIVESIDE
jgi:dTMP kinase